MFLYIGCLLLLRARQNGARSSLDHVFVSPNLVSQVKEVSVSFNVDNKSDHFQLHVAFEMDLGPQLNPRVKPVKQLWPKATPQCLGQYAHSLEIALAACEKPQAAVNCHDSLCNSPEHIDSLQRYHDRLIQCCLGACACIPKSSSSSRTIPGWNQYIKPSRDRALFWHRLWIENGRPQHGVVASVRRYTIILAHYITRLSSGLDRWRMR